MTVSMSAVWDRTTEFLGDRGGAIFALVALAVFLPAAIGESLAPLKPTLGPAGGLGLSLLSLALGLLSLWGQLAITALVLDPARDPAAGRAVATRRLPAMIGVALALLLIGLVLTLPILGTLVANGVDPTRLTQAAAAQALPAGALGLIGLYGVFVLLPLMLFLAARLWVLAGPVVLAEDLALGAIGRAFRLSRGLTWRIVGVLLLYGIVMFVATLAAGTVAGALFRVMLGGDGPVTAATVLTAVVAAIVSTIFSVLATVFCAKLYLAVRTREDAREDVPAT